MKILGLSHTVFVHHVSDTALYYIVLQYTFYALFCRCCTRAGRAAPWTGRARCPPPSTNWVQWYNYVLKYTFHTADVLIYSVQFVQM